MLSKIIEITLLGISCNFVVRITKGAIIFKILSYDSCKMNLTIIEYKTNHASKSEIYSIILS